MAPRPARRNLGGHRRRPGRRRRGPRHRPAGCARAGGGLAAADRAAHDRGRTVERLDLSPAGGRYRHRSLVSGSGAMTGLSTAERAALESAFLVGLGRQPMAVPALAAGAAEDKVALACLGLLAQRRRFDRPGPVPPPPVAPRIARDDDRAILEP